VPHENCTGSCTTDCASRDDPSDPLFRFNEAAIVYHVRQQFESVSAKKPMHWQLYSATEPSLNPKSQASGVVETTLSSLAKLDLAQDALERIAHALKSHAGEIDQTTVRILVAQPAPDASQSHSWCFFILTPGQAATDAETGPILELYLY
jgi:hypothetical protein